MKYTELRNKLNFFITIVRRSNKYRITKILHFKG